MTNTFNGKKLAKHITILATVGLFFRHYTQQLLQETEGKHRKLSICLFFRHYTQQLLQETEGKHRKLSICWIWNKDHHLLNISLVTLNYNFACGSVWVRNFVSNIKGGTQTEGV
jgi:hypothetical protein